MEDRQCLAQSRLFAGLDEAGLSSLLQVAEMELRDADDRIFSEGEEGDRLFVVMQGEVRISLEVGGGEEALAILGPGSTFGEMAVFEPEAGPRSAAAIANGDCTLLSIAREPLAQLMKKEPALAACMLRNVVRDLAAQLRATNHKVVFLASAGRF